MKHVTYLDQSGVYAFESAINDLQNAGVTVLMTIVQPQAMSMITTLGVIPNLVSEDHIFPNFSACIEWLRNNTPAET